MNTRQRPPPRPWWQRAALLGQAAWFFGNLYEGVVGVPQLLADARTQRASRLFGTGSPVRYYAPIAPVVIGATGVALVRSWWSGGDRRLIMVAAGSTTTAAALSAYLVRSVNLRLLTSDEPLSDRDRRRMILTWHSTNMVRLGALAVASASLSHTTSVLPPTST